MTRLHAWLILLLLLGAAAYALAEELTLTTYYPSPRGVYSELRTLGNVQIGDIAAPALDPAPRLYIAKEATDTRPLLRIDDGGAGDATPLIVDAAGNVGVGGLLTTGSFDADAPNAAAGTLYFNSASNRLRMRVNGLWADVVASTNVAGTNPSCPAGMTALKRNFVGNVCGPYPNGGMCGVEGCSIPAGWGVEADCAYQYHTDNCCGCQTGWIQATCQSDWTEVVCVTSDAFTP